MSPAEDISTRHGSSATSSGTAAVRAWPLPSRSTVRRGVPKRLATSASSLETSPRSFCSDSRIAVSSAISRCSVSRSSVDANPTEAAELPSEASRVSLNVIVSPISLHSDPDRSDAWTTRKVSSIWTFIPQASGVGGRVPRR